MADELIELGQPRQRMDRPFLSQRRETTAVSSEAVVYLRRVYADALEMLADMIQTDPNHLEEGQTAALESVEMLLQELPSLGALVGRVAVCGAALGSRTDFRPLLERSFGRGEANALLAQARADILHDTPSDIKDDVARALGGKPGVGKGGIGIAEVAIPAGVGLALALAL